MSPKPQFQPGETLNIVRYIPPLPKGATVTVKRIEFRGDEYQYVVEGRRTPEGESIEVWADEIDLKMPLIFEAPRKKRKGSLAFELQSALQASTSISALPTVNGNGHSTPTAAPIAEPRVRRRRRSAESVGGLIPTRTGRAARSRDIESILYSERPATNGEAKTSRQLKESPKLKESSKADVAPRAIRGRSKKEAVSAAPAPKPSPEPKAVKQSRAVAAPEPASRSKSAAAGITRKSSSNAVTAKTKRSTTGAPIAEPAQSGRVKAPAAPKRARGKAAGVKAASGKSSRTKGTDSAETSADKPVRTRRSRSAEAVAPTVLPAKALKKPATRRRKKRKSAATTKARGASAVVARKPESTGRSRRKDSSVGTRDSSAGNGAIQTAVGSRRGTRSRQSQAGLTGNPFIDGLLNGQAFPGGMVLSGANGAPIVIIIVNAAPVDTTAETARKRRER